MKKLQLLAAFTAACFASQYSQITQAHPGVRWSIGFNLGGPGYYRPYYGYGPYYSPYYGPAPLYYEPIPVAVRPAPVVLAVPSAPVAVAPPPVAAPAVVRASNDTPGSPRVDALLQQLSDWKENVRSGAAMDLGRLKAQNAVDPLQKLLAKDASPGVRDAAARALGLIGASRSLNALIYAAQEDADRDVRRSAQFAVEVIRANLR